MKKHSVSIFESNTSSGLENMITDFCKQDLEITNISYSTFCNQNNGNVLYSAALAYTYSIDIENGLTNI